MASKSNGVESTDWARAPPPSRPLGQRILRAFYDPDEKTFLGRTPKRWGIAITFYLVFYAVLAAMFAVCMAGLFYVIDEEKPTYILDKSLIGANPGVTSRPIPYDGVTMHFSKQNSTEIDYYTRELEEFFEPYKNESWFASMKECTFGDNFGYPDSPCLFIKLNRIYGWKPEYYESNFPEDMKPDLVNYINSLADAERQQIWVSCWDEHSNETKIEYPWGRGLASRFYPYLNEVGYLSPILAVRITVPVNTLSVLRCRAWAKNIIYNKSLKEGTGYTRISLQVGDHSTLESNSTNST